MTVSNKRRPLTGTERAVLSWLAQGENNRQVGVRLGVDVRSVENTIRRARRALGAENAVHAVFLALTTHQIPPKPCGTEAAYWWHVKRGDHADPACRAAHAAQRARQRAAARRNGLSTP